MDTTPTIKAVQAFLGLTVDGIAGAKTWAAIADALGLENELVRPAPLPDTGDLVDPRSESNIDSLLPVVRPLARQLIREANEAVSPKTVKITSGYRTYSEQATLYQQGRNGNPGRIVTNAPPGYSNHNFALAFDVTLFDENGSPIWESGLYQTIGKIGRGIGLLWGGDWTHADEPHFEYRPEWAADLGESQALAEYRERQKQGLALV